jgi:uncharacterized membrane protein
VKKTHLIAFSASGGLLVASLVATFSLWPDLPAQIPLHFGLDGSADAWITKNIFTALLVPVIHLGFILLLVLIYRYPQFSSIPTTLILTSLEDKKRDKIYAVIRGALGAITLIASLLFAYIQLAILATANQRTEGITPSIMVGLIASLLIVLLFFPFKMYFTIQELNKKKD